VKFIIVPLMIIGMFASFALALIAMLFFTHTVNSYDELRELVEGGPDSTQVLDQFNVAEDRLQAIFDLANQYRKTEEQKARQAAMLHDSLAAERTRLQALEDSLLREQHRLGLISDSTSKAVKARNLADLARFYESIKAQAAAEILQQEAELSDTTVAGLMEKLTPRQMAKIMAKMDPDYAARITKLMKEQSP